MKLKALSQVALIASPFRILCTTKNLLKVSHRLWTAEAGSLRPICLRFTEVSFLGIVRWLAPGHKHWGKPSGHISILIHLNPLCPHQHHRHTPTQTGILTLGTQALRNVVWTSVATSDPTLRLRQTVIRITVYPEPRVDVSRKGFVITV